MIKRLNQCFTAFFFSLMFMTNLITILKLPKWSIWVLFLRWQRSINLFWPHQCEVNPHWHLHGLTLWKICFFLTEWHLIYPKFTSIRTHYNLNLSKERRVADVQRGGRAGIESRPAPFALSLNACLNKSSGRWATWVTRIVIFLWWVGRRSASLVTPTVSQPWLSTIKNAWVKLWSHPGCLEKSSDHIRHFYC